MYTLWTTHLQDLKDKTEFNNRIAGSKPVLDRLHQILDTDELVLSRTEVDVNIFDSPNWAYKQAYMNGYKACLNKYKKLINLDQQKESL